MKSMLEENIKEATFMFLFDFETDGRFRHDCELFLIHASSPVTLQRLIDTLDQLSLRPNVTGIQSIFRGCEGRDESLLVKSMDLEAVMTSLDSSSMVWAKKIGRMNIDVDKEGASRQRVLIRIIALSICKDASEVFSDNGAIC